MYTECPSCQTYFKITPNQLKAAGGKVRCGNCDNVFGALDSLVDVVPDDVLSQLASSAVTEYSSAQEEALSLALSEPQISRVAQSNVEDSAEGSEAGNFTELLNNSEIEEKSDNAISDTELDAPSVISAEEENISITLSSEIDNTPNVESESVESKSLLKENEISNDIDAALDGLFDGSTEVSIGDTRPTSTTDSAPSQLSSVSELDEIEELGFDEVGNKNEKKQTDVALEESSELKSSLEAINDTEPTSLSQFEREFSSSSTKNTILDESNFDLGDSFLDTDIDQNNTEKTKSTSTLDDSDSQSDDSYVLEELEESTKQSTGVISKVIWIVVIISLLVILIIQFAFVKRQELAMYPALKPAIENLCMNLNKIYPCEISAAKNVSAIELLERNVISHPNAKNALLITSTIENKAKFDQPFPELTLTFSDINQKIIAKRKFTPKEYLSKDVDIEAGMKMNVPIKLMLEIVDPGEEAVNFEFNFQ